MLYRKWLTRKGIYFDAGHIAHSGENRGSFPYEASAGTVLTSIFVVNVVIMLALYAMMSLHVYRNIYHLLEFPYVLLAGFVLLAMHMIIGIYNNMSKASILLLLWSNMTGYMMFYVVFSTLVMAWRVDSFWLVVIVLLAVNGWFRLWE